PDSATPTPHTLSLHDALPISRSAQRGGELLVVVDQIQQLAREAVRRCARSRAQGFQVDAGVGLVEHDVETDQRGAGVGQPLDERDRKSTRLNSSHVAISYAVF